MAIKDSKKKMLQLALTNCSMSASPFSLAIPAARIWSLADCRASRTAALGLRSRPRADADGLRSFETPSPDRSPDVDRFLSRNQISLH